MAKNKIELGCKQLRGNFVMSGKVSGRYSNRFYAEGTSDNGTKWRRVCMGIEIEPGKIVYLDIFGSVQDQVYFSKTTKVGGKNVTQTKAVRWDDRMKNPKTLFGEDGFRMIGITCGCKKTIDKNEKEINDSKHLTAYDACDEVGNLTDGNSVFVRGNIVYQTYNGQHRVRFEPTQISLTRNEIDFDAIDFQPNSEFVQPIVCMGVTKSEDDPGEYVVAAKIVNYSSIEDTEFYTRNAGLAKNLKKLGEYCHIRVSGNIVVEGEVQEEEVDTGWGKEARMEKVVTPFKRKLMITGAKPETIDKESYSKDVIENAMEIIAGIQGAKKDYGKKDEFDEDDWGETDSKKKGNKSSGLSSNFDDDEDDDFDLSIDSVM